MAEAFEQAWEKVWIRGLLPGMCEEGVEDPDCQPILLSSALLQVQQEHVKFQNKLKADRAKMDADLAQAAVEVATYKDCVDDKDMVRRQLALEEGCGQSHLWKHHTITRLHLDPS